MKILFIIESLGPGGKERRLVELLTYLTKKGDCNNTLLLLDNDIHYSSLYSTNTKVKVLNRKKGRVNYSLFFTLIKLTRQEKPDVICTWGNVSTIYSIPSVLITKIPLVNCQITSLNPRAGGLSFFNIQLKINFCISKIIISNSFAGLKSFNVNKNKGRVIHNGISPDRFLNLNNPGIIRTKYNIDSKVCIAMVGAFSDYKDFQTFIKTAKEFEILNRDISFLCVGGGEKLTQIKEYVQANDIKNVYFTGTVNNVEQIINAMDIGVLLSPIGEGISNSILEFMYLKKPVIANDKGGTREIILDGFNGFLLPDINVELLKEKILILLDNPCLFKKIGDNAYLTICNKFSLTRMGDEFYFLFKDVIISVH